MSESVIHLENVSIYQQEQLVLSDVNFTVNKGDFVYLIGKVGSGKTSLMKTLYAGIPLLEGTGKVADYSLEKLHNKDIPFLRRKIGIVFQDFQLLTDRSVRNNLYYVLRATGWTDKEKINSRIQEVLNKVGLIDKIDKMPHQLSGGEQQRIVIARAILNEPELILADEPTGNLDPETSDEIMNLLMAIKNNGNTIVMATHNYYLLKKYPGRIIKCERNKLTEIDESIAAIDFSDLEE